MSANSLGHNPAGILSVCHTSSDYPPLPLAPSASFVSHSIRRLIWLRCHAGACRGDAKDMLEASSSSSESVSELHSCMSADGALHLHASLASSSIGCPRVRAEQFVPEPSEICPLCRASASACRTADHVHYNCNGWCRKCCVRAGCKQHITMPHATISSDCCGRLRKCYMVHLARASRVADMDLYQSIVANPRGALLPYVISRMLGAAAGARLAALRRRIVHMHRRRLLRRSMMMCGR